MILLNRNVLEHRILQEQYTAAPVKHDKNSINLTFFDRFNQIGEYLKIEVWGILRNKRLRLIFFLNTFGIFIFNIFKCEASPSMSMLFPGCAKIGCSEKLGNTSISIVGWSHSISWLNRPPCTFIVSKPLMVPSEL